MTSKERILAALRREETDHLPCVLYFWSSPVVEGYRWETEAERLEVITERLGADALMHFTVGAGRHPEVRERVWQEHPAGERYPLLHKEVETPAGPLQAIVRRTEDWPHGDDVPFFSDFNVSRYVKPWLESLEDVERWAYVYQPPGDAQIAAARERWQLVRALAERWQVPVMGTYTLGLTGAIHLFGAQQGVTLSMDEPEALSRYVEITAGADTACLDVLLDLGIDIVRRNGWYESTDFWSPTQFRRWVKPDLERGIHAAHQAGRPFNYTLCTGIMPLVPILAGLELDSLDTIEPVLGGQDMPRLARELGNSRCLWGGISAPIHLGESKPEQVRAAVRLAVETFGRRGFILNPVPSIRAHWPWANLMAMLDEWRRVR